jgi:hypothetical protein
MIGNDIIISAEPQGRFLEGIVDGTPLPGTCMQIKAGVAAQSGRLTYEAYDADADGDMRPILVLLNKRSRGEDVDSAAVDGERIQLYAPAMGEELNVRVAAPGTGTSDAFAVGDLLMINAGDGLLIASASTPESEPFQVIEAVSDVVSTGTLVACMYTGC